MMFRKLNAAYNYTLGALLAARRNETPYEWNTPFEKVILLDPKIDLSQTGGWRDLATIITGLVQVAKLSRQIIVMPSVPCITQWLHDPWFLSLYTKVCTAPLFWQDDGSRLWPIVHPIEASGELLVELVELVAG